MIVVFDGDDTLWHNEDDYQATHREFESLLAPWAGPETAASTLDRHGIEADDFVMVGNSLRSDVLPVIELGGTGVHVPYATTWRHELVDGDHGHEIPTLTSLTELPDWLESSR